MSGPRSFTLTDTGHRPLTTNAERKMHRLTAAQHIALSRETWAWLAKAHRIPHLGRVAITVTPIYSSGRSLSDPGAVAPEAKAAIDGLRDAGVLTDDTGRHVASITFLAPIVSNVDGLRIDLLEVPA